MLTKYSASGLGILCICGGMVFGLAALSQATAQTVPTAAVGSTPPPDASINDVLKAAVASFNTGDFQGAATSLERVLADASDSPGLEGVYYLLGSAYFNMANYPKAIEVFNKYKTKFPKGERFVQVSFSLGQAYMFTKQFPQAAAEFQALDKVSPQFRQESLLFAAESLRQQGNIDEAITTLEKLLTGGVNSAIAAKAALMLAPFYADKDQPQKAVDLLLELQKNINLIENIVQFNGVAIKLGDKFLDKKMYQEALTCYRTVPLRDEVIKLQAARIQNMQDTVTRDSAAIQADPRSAPELFPTINRIKGDIQQANALLAEFQKLPAYAPTLDLRMGRAFYELGKKWESIVAFGEVLAKFPTSVEAEPSLFGMVVAYVDLQRTKDAQTYGAQYLKDFATGPNAGTVGYLMGAVALNAGDLAGSEKIFAQMLVDQPNSTYREEMLFMLATTKFAQLKFEDASTAFTNYLTAFPSGTHAEDAAYHVAIAPLFEGKPFDALAPLQDFLKKYPSGAYAADAKYRVGVCESSEQKYDDVLALCKDWQRDYPGNAELGEVLALQGDALAGTGKTDDAIDSYIRAYKAAAAPETVKYALFDGAVKLLTKKADWERLSTVLEEFVKNNSDSPLTVTAFLEIGKARVREDKLQEAKTFLADSVKKFMGDKDRDDVERILTLLVQLCVRKGHPIAVAEGETPAPSPTPPPDPTGELEHLLSGAGADANATARARIRFARAEMAGVLKQRVMEAQDYLSIASQYKPEDLSATMLAKTAGQMVQAGELDKAAALYAELEKTYPKSDQIDSARVGLGEIAFQKKDFNLALKQFSEGVDKSSSAEVLKDATVGKAKTLLALNRLEEAKKIFNEIAAVREWRGPATAESVYSLGQIAGKQGKLPEAIAFYQRVYVAYQRYLPWVAKAYLASGVAFEKLGKIPEAVNTYNEMLRNDKLSTFPETEEARQRLQALPAQPPAAKG